jgi:dolichol-phosphate mannosyltransferase
MITEVNKNEQSLISIVLPCMNESENIEIIYNRIRECLPVEYMYEIIFVDDGSKDETLAAVKKLRSSDKNVHFISFARNFGHMAALKAGLDYAKGDCVITMDADLQHPPELIPEFIAKWNAGYKIVNTRRAMDPSLSFVKRKCSSFFYRLINSISDIKLENGAADFRLLDRVVVEVIRKAKENGLFLRGYINWVGFKTVWIDYQPSKREFGETKYSLAKMFKFAVLGLTAFSTSPLRLALFLGGVVSLFAFFYMAYALSIHFFSDAVLPGWTSVLVSVLFLGGIQLLVLGLMGEYLGRVFMQVKFRPDYIVAESSGELHQ